MERICIVRHREYPDAVPTRRNAETLAAQGYEVDVLCIRKSGEAGREKVRGVDVYRLPLEHHRKGISRYIFEYTAFFLLAFFKLSWLAVTRRYRVVQIDNMPDFIVFTALLPRLLGAKIVFQLLDHTPDVFADSYKLSDRHIVIRLLRWLEKASVRWADFCIGTQVFNKQVMENHGVPGSKIAVVLNVPDDIFVGKTAPSRVDDGYFTLVTHGNLLEKYGVQTLIKAVPLVTQEIPNLKVKIVGKGEHKKALEELTRSLGVEKYVEFTGFVPPGEVACHLAQADVGIVSILLNRNPMLPNKLFEYLALGKPSIVTAIPVIKHYFDDNTVMYYEPDNATDLAGCILDLYKNPQKRAALAGAGAAAYKNYQWSVMKQAYLAVFENIMDKGHYADKILAPSMREK